MANLKDYTTINHLNKNKMKLTFIIILVFIGTPIFAQEAPIGVADQTPPGLINLPHPNTLEERLVAYASQQGTNYDSTHYYYTAQSDLIHSIQTKYKKDNNDFVMLFSSDTFLIDNKNRIINIKNYLWNAPKFDLYGQQTNTYTDFETIKLKQSYQENTWTNIQKTQTIYYPNQSPQEETEFTWVSPQQHWVSTQKSYYNTDGFITQQISSPLAFPKSQTFFQRNSNNQTLIQLKQIFDTTTNTYKNNQYHQFSWNQENFETIHHYNWTNNHWIIYALTHQSFNEQNQLSTRIFKDTLSDGTSLNKTLKEYEYYPNGLRKSIKSSTWDTISSDWQLRHIFQIIYDGHDNIVHIFTSNWNNNTEQIIPSYQQLFTYNQYNNNTSATLIHWNTTTEDWDLLHLEKWYYEAYENASSNHDVPILSHTLYPNPTTGLLHIDIEAPCMITFYNTQGQPITSKKIIPRETIDIQEFISGLYHYKIWNKNKENYGHFLKL